MSDRQTSTIQVDMFDVQLGAALLLQFRNNDGHVVRVLADAGVDPKSGYAQNHVLAPLKQAMKDFDGANPRLDLIIGTHYDADHLEGLIPIINDRSIDISEAWMPPVANDTVSHSLDDEPEERELLAKQFDSDDGSAVLQNYFHSKLRDCEYLQALQRAAEELAENGDRALRRGHQEVERWSERTRDDWINAFRQHFDEAAKAFQPSEVHTHADDPIQTLIDLTQGVASDDNLDMSAPKLMAAIDDQPHGPKHLWYWLRQKIHLNRLLAAGDDDLKQYWLGHRHRAKVDARSLAMLRKSTAKNAITASSLEKVVVAVRARKIPISCPIINNGLPRRFVWRSNARRFDEGPRLLGAPELKLLGPSRALVKKHWDRLPIGVYARMMFAVLLPSKSITPSNELSYVARLSLEGQGILVSGDAGCVDFARNRRSGFYKALLDALMPLHIVQIAHHGGRNAQFYNVLLSAPYATQAASSKLLLSHATNDAHRPSDLFAQFVAAVRKNVDIQILFTGRPRDAYVKDYKTLIAPPIGPPQPKGDIRLVFDGHNWAVRRHAVDV